MYFREQQGGKLSKPIATLFLLIASFLTAIADSAPLTDTRQSAVLFFCKNFTLSTKSGKNVINVNGLPVSLPKASDVKFIYTSSPEHPNGRVLLFLNLDTCKSWCYLSTDVLAVGKGPNDAPAKETLRTIFSKAEADNRVAPEAAEENIIGQLIDRNSLEIEDGEINSGSTDESLQLKDLDFQWSKLSFPDPILDTVKSHGAISTEDLTGKTNPYSAFNNAHFHLFPFFHGVSSTIKPPDLATSEAWMAAWCAANNTTLSSRTGQVSLGATWVDRRVIPRGKNHFSIEYRVVYFGLGKSKGKISGIGYGVDPEIDAGFKPLIRFPPFLSEFYDSIFKPSYPDISYDKKNGVSQSISIQTKTFANPNDKKSRDYDPQEGLSFAANGGNSFDHDYYNITAGPTWTFAQKESPFTSSDLSEIGNPSLGSNFIRSVSPQGNGTKDVIGGELVGDLKRSFQNKQDQIMLDFALDYSHIEGLPVTAKPPSVDTDEYSGTFFFQNILYFPNRTRDEVVASTDRWADGEVDSSAWLRPAESTQNSNFYADGLAKVHLGMDVPVLDTHQVVRVDWSLTGGGIVGVSPATSRFFAGSNLNESAQEAANTVPSPVIRSLGTNTGGVYSVSSKLGGATSYANQDLTIALPLPFAPFCSSTVLQEDGERHDFMMQCVDLFEGDVPAENNLYYIGNYETFFSIKPLVTCDAVWLGAPNGFSDRSITSVGAGGEITLGVLNFDIVYAKTVFDTSTQTKSANLTFQATYDIHF
jgi:hypothetical protein